MLLCFSEDDGRSITDIEGLIGYYDPSDLSTLWQDSSATTPVTSDGDPVGRIDDKSGAGNHLIQTTSAARPVYKTSGGLHWLSFDGIDDELNTSGNIVNDQDYYAAVVFEAVGATTASAGYRNVFGLGTGGGANSQCIAMQKFVSGNVQLGAFCRPGASTQAAVFLANQPLEDQIQIVEARYSDSVIGLTVAEGTEATQPTATSGTVTNTLDICGFPNVPVNFYGGAFVNQATVEADKAIIRSTLKPLGGV